MVTLKFEDRESWLAARLGRITGSRLKDIVVKRGNNKKIGYYELIAERLGIPADDESAMDRGTRLEPEAIARFQAMTGKKVDTSLVLWTREEDQNIAVSPDGIIGKTEALEAKCLSSARHIEAFLTQQVPAEYELQALQYFIVNDKLKKLYFCFYDPRLMINDFFFLEIDRDSREKEIEEYLAFERDTLQEIEDIVKKLFTF